jgi:hypothetical protein
MRTVSGPHTSNSFVQDRVGILWRPCVTAGVHLRKIPLQLPGLFPSRFLRSCVRLDGADTDGLILLNWTPQEAFDSDSLFRG